MRGRGVFLIRYCVPCQSVKSPWAHHCRTCNACIDDMDHHCPFIANCVGRRNLHNFLLFLFWTGIGAMYAMLTCILVIASSWQSLIHRRGHRYRGSIIDLTLSFTNSVPWCVRDPSAKLIHRAVLGSRWQRVTCLSCALRDRLACFFYLDHNCGSFREGKVTSKCSRMANRLPDMKASMHR